ncbi:PhoX family protein [Kitasatospora sp. NPDC059160]|uniref:PhoX family protein n=1 Tax=Kitasatospora sp. NPDC059160 TaxID=3346748 RepID=UPI0036B287F5
MPDHDTPQPETAPRRTFDDVVAAGLSRRQALTGGTIALAAFLGLSASPASAAPAGQPGTAGAAAHPLGFTAVPASSADAVTVPAGYSVQVLAPWGQAVRESGPKWRADGGNTAAEQAEQVGSHHAGLHFFPGTDDSHGTLVLTHESTDAALLYGRTGAAATEGRVSKEQVAKALAAHGVSVLEVRRTGGTWQLADSPRNVRVTGATPVTFSGPVGADHPALRTGTPATGTLGTGAHGVTPWGTFLAGERNTAGYFGTDDRTWRATRAQKRAGLGARGDGHGWHRADARFDLAVNGNEANRFGWVVEIDPADPQAAPVKRTALGRFQHVGASVTESAGRVVVYSGDDENGGYLYKFVGSDSWWRLRSQGRSPLDHGTLYVARFEDDGTGRWLPLTHGQGPLTVANGWADQADVLLRARLAADSLGATPLERPQQTSVSPDGTAFCALANSPGLGHCAAGPNAHRAAVSPRAENPYGHVIRWREDGTADQGDGRATGFHWQVFVLAGDPAHDHQVHLDAAGMFASPKNLWSDADGRLWIGTGIPAYDQNRAETGHEHLGNNAMLAADPATGEVRRFLTGPRGAEITGVVTTPDRRTMFVNVQHPGEHTLAWGTPTQDDPRAVSNWPDHDAAGRPRSAVLVIRRTDGGVIGAA